MFKKLSALLKKKEPYWNEFYLKNIPGPSANSGFEAAMQNVTSESVPFENRKNLRTFLDSILPIPGKWDTSNGKVLLDCDGEEIQIEIGLLEEVSGVTVSVKSLGPPKHAAEIANAIQSKYQLKISGMGNNPYVA